MPRRKSKYPEKRLSRPLIVRLTEGTFNRLEMLVEQSSCQSVGEVARKILTQEKIPMLHRDISMNGTMEELALIRKELKSIGININQQTRYFHTAKNEAQRSFYFMRTTDLYQNVAKKIDELLGIVSLLAKKWLQES